MTSNTLSRPALRYMGGKWRLAPWIIQHMPAHMSYVEPFGGAASVLLRKPRSFCEIYNDLDNEVVGLFRVLRDPDSAFELARLVDLTPWARCEFEQSFEVTDDPIERARRTVMRSFMGFGSTAVALRRRTGFRRQSVRNGKHPARDWAGMPEAIVQLCERLRGVVIEHMDALELIDACDGPETLFYLDPPYIHASRSQKRTHGELEHAYAHEMTDEQHAFLLAKMEQLKGMVMISGYATPLYDQALKHWDRVETAALADGAKKRREVLWMNEAATRGTGMLGHFG